jgi:hypothetical protein
MLYPGPYTNMYERYSLLQKCDIETFFGKKKRWEEGGGRGEGDIANLFSKGFPWRVSPMEPLRGQDMANISPIIFIPTIFIQSTG